MLNKTQKKVAIGSLLIVTVIGYLIYSAAQSNANYYQTVCEAKKLSANKSKRLRLEGKVASGSLKQDSQSLKISFLLKEDPAKGSNCNEEIAIDYQGVAPDLMQEDITVIAEGTFLNSGSFKADRLLTSCPSRYDAAKEFDDSPHPSAPAKLPDNIVHPPSK
ncbi:MAG: cytochrome c maturation protein CcmE [Nitrospinota bacterium]